MRKGWIGLLAAVMLLFGSTAYAHGKDHHGSKNGHDAIKACDNTIKGLENALSKAKNDKAKKAIRKAIDDVKKHCVKNDPKPSKPMTDAQRVAADKAGLAIGYADGDSASRVTRSISLPTRGKNGSAIVWTSGSPSFIGDDGKLAARPANSAGDVTVVMFAVIKHNQVADYRTFRIVIKQKQNDAETVAADKAALQIEYNGSDHGSNVTQAIRLATTGPYGSNIKWTSSNPAVISHDGKTVNRPDYGKGDAVVVLTAMIQSGAAVDTKVFTVTVKQQYNDEETVAADKAELTIGFTGSDNAANVTGNVRLITEGHYGSDIVWVSSHPNVISSDGTVVRPARASGDVTTELTAVIVFNGRADYKTFTLTVKAKESK